MKTHRKRMGLAILAAAMALALTAAGSGCGNESSDSRPESLRDATSGWGTNWEKHSIDYAELLSGGPPRDGIPSIDEPAFITPGEASQWLADNEPVIAL